MTAGCVRRARADDAGMIAQLYRQLTGNPDVCVLPERIAELAARADSMLLVAEQEAVVRGTALLSLCADVMFRAQPYAVVENLVIDAPARGRGLGAALMREIERLCRERDCSKILLLSNARREAAHRFFEALGYAGEVKRGFVKYRSAFAPPESVRQTLVGRADRPAD